MNKDAEIKDGKVQEDALSQIDSSGFAVAIGGNSRQTVSRHYHLHT